MANDDIQGTVTDANGNAVGGAIVALWYQGSPNKVVTTQADSNGNYIFTGHPDADGTSRNWHVAARDPTDKTRQFPSLHSVSSQLSAAIPDSGVALYNFEQDLIDSWGGNNGTDNTSAGYTTNSQEGTYAKRFDGTDDYVAVNRISFSTPATWAYWIYETSGNARHLSNQSTPTMYVRSDTYTNGELWANIYDGSANYRMTTSTNIPTNQWAHIAYAVDSDNGDARLYLDGSRIASTSGSGSFNMGDVYLGQKRNGSRHVDGYMDDVRLYDKALSDTEVSNLYTSGTI